MPFDQRYGDATGQLGADALRQKSALAQKDDATTGQLIYGRAKAEQKYLKGAESAIDSPRPPLPTYEKIKNEPNPEDYHKYSVEFASASALLGAIAGKWTRAGGTASLNAFAGAMQGWQKGNLQAYEEASKQWEQASKKTIDNNNIELAKYKAILEDRKMNIDDKLQGLTIAGYEAQNSVIVGMGKDGNFNGIAQAVDKMAMANQRYGAAVDQLSGVHKDQTADQVAQIEYLNSNPEFARQLQQRDPGKWAQIGAAGELYRHPLNNPPPAAGGGTLDADAERYRQTGTLPPNMGRGNQGYEQAHEIRQRAAELEVQSGGDPTNWPTKWQQFKAQGVGLNREQGALGNRAGGISIAVNEADRTIPVVRQLAEQNAGKGYATWNKIQNKWAVESGDKGFQQYVAQLNSLVNIYGRVISGGNKGTVSDLEHARELANPNMPLSAIQGSLAAMETEIGIAETAPEQVRDAIRRKGERTGDGAKMDGDMPPPPPGYHVQ